MNNTVPELKTAEIEYRQMHWFYFLFLEFSVFAALWQHANPGLCLLLLALIPPSGLLIYIPYRFLKRNSRHFIQIAIFTLSILWGFARFGSHTPLDMAIIEAVCILGLAFTIDIKESDYGYILILGMLLLIYGALIPRTAYLISAPPALFCGLLIMYSTRTAALASDQNIKTPPGVWRWNFIYTLLHMGFCAVIMAGIYAILPNSPRQGSGIAEVSFRNENESIVHDFRHWVRGKYYKKSPNGHIKQSGDSPDSEGPDGEPASFEFSKQAVQPGKGGGSTGNEMVFQIKSPLKLYWLGQLYDSYDGDKWIASDSMKKQESILKPSVWKYTEKIEQKITIDKWVSKNLFGAFEFYYLNPGNNYLDKVDSNIASKRFRPELQLPDPPFSYTVVSNVISVSGTPAEVISDPLFFWSEQLMPEHYMELPAGKISERVKKLAASLTNNSMTQYEKAISLRDYLRENYKYLQFAAKTPPDRESVDYFLFDLKTGNCQYFAAALTVLARLNGLPARLATGFSPGDFNVLTNSFEVYEYHAHAWTQIFIPESGWLTFDAVPPGEIVSKTNPMIIGSFHDPFSDEWRIIPPEITNDAKIFLQNEKNENSKHDKDSAINRLSVGLRLIVKMASIPELMAELADELKDKFFPSPNNENMKIKDLLKLMLHNLKETGLNLLSAFLNFIKWLFSSEGLLGLASFILIFLLYRLLGNLRYMLLSRFRLRKCLRLYASLESRISKEPETVINISYRICREILNFAAHPRQHNMELFSYASSLKKINIDLAGNFFVVCFLYSKLTYGKKAAETSDAAEAYQRAGLVKDFLLKHIVEERKKRTKADVITELLSRK